MKMHTIRARKCFLHSFAPIARTDTGQGSSSLCHQRHLPPRLIAQQARGRHRQPHQLIGLQHTNRRRGRLPRISIAVGGTFEFTGINNLQTGANVERGFKEMGVRRARTAYPVKILMRGGGVAGYSHRAVKPAPSFFGGTLEYRSLKQWPMIIAGLLFLQIDSGASCPPVTNQQRRCGDAQESTSGRVRR